MVAHWELFQGGATDRCSLNTLPLACSPYYTRRDHHETYLVHDSGDHPMMLLNNFISGYIETYVSL